MLSNSNIETNKSLVMAVKACWVKIQQVHGVTVASNRQVWVLFTRTWFQLLGLINLLNLSSPKLDISITTKRMMTAKILYKSAE